MAGKRDERALEQRMRQWIRDHEPQEWWLWQITPDQGRVTVVPKIPWPYVMPDPKGDEWPGWGMIVVRDMLNQKKAGDMMASIRLDMIRRLRVGHGSTSDFTYDAKLLGRMLTVTYELHGRGGPFKWIWTPPVYKFCDTDKMNPAWKKFIAPHDFWIQPEVYLETGQIMQGSPTYNAVTDIDRRDDIDNILDAARPMALAEMIADTRRAEDGREALEAIHIALDSWLEGYERTGETNPRAEFAWTFAEQRAALETRMTKTCQWKMGGMRVKCGKPAVMNLRWTGMQSLLPVCQEHYDDALEEGYETAGPVVPQPEQRSSELEYYYIVIGDVRQPATFSSMRRARAAALELVGPGAAVVEVWHLAHGGRHLQGQATADGWSDV